MTSQVPIRLAVQRGLTDLLKTITPANGYQSDLSDYDDAPSGTTKSRVFRGRNIFGFTDPMPMVAILQNPHTEPNQQLDGRYSGQNVGPKEFLIQGFVEDDPDNPTDPAEYLLADVQKCLALHKRSQSGPMVQQAYFGVTGTPGNGITDFHIGTGVVRPVDDVTPYANFWLLLTIEIAEDMANPFAWS